MKHALSIAGIDPLGGAGIFADLKVFIAHNVYAMGVATATTAQNTKGLYALELISTDIIKKGIEALFDDVRVDVVKIGVVPSVDIIKVVANTLKEQNKNNIPIVLDPVMSCKNGDIWLQGEAKEAIVNELFGIASIITPNKFEAQEILNTKLNTKDELVDATKELLKFGSKSVFLKGGDVNGKSTDIFYDGKELLILEETRLDTTSTHGSGCSLSSAIASNLANGLSTKESVIKAKKYVFEAIKHAFKVGQGCNPINHFYNFNK